MKFFLPFTLAFLSAITCSAQLEITESIKDFGLLRRADSHWIDVEIKNLGSKTAYIFRVDAPKNVEIKFSSKEIPAGGNAFIRIAYSPKVEGKFKEELGVHASAWNSPKKIEIFGESTHAVSSVVPCPDFGSEGRTSSSEFHVSVKSLGDERSIEDAEIDIYKNGEKVYEFKTDQYGELTRAIPYGRYLIAVRKGSAEIDTAMYVNAVNNHLVVSLENIEDDLPMGNNVEIDEEIAEESITETPAEEEEADSVAEVKELERTSLPEDSEPAEETEYEELPVSTYKQNNLVFLVDVSASMKQRGKLDLMKISIIELLKVLRPVDRFTLISYSSDTEVLVQTDSNLDRDACIEAIRNLSAGGGTAGARAIKKAGKLAERSFVDNGNNQILLATDGAFNEEIDKALRFARRNRRREIGMSVMGIKCGPFTEKQMTTLVGESGGQFILIEGASDADERLIEEIKRSSRR
ncbi:MAG: VWA domain-containing protein [Cryomorphaceae bacterium]|nr:VWA domain-containing protein [Flavobacteriales bacterium]